MVNGHDFVRTFLDAKAKFWIISGYSKTNLLCCVKTKTSQWSSPSVQCSTHSTWDYQKVHSKFSNKLEIQQLHVHFSEDCLAESTGISIGLSAATCKSCHNNINRDISQYQTGLIEYHKVDTYQSICEYHKLPMSRTLTQKPVSSHDGKDPTNHLSIW